MRILSGYKHCAVALDLSSDQKTPILLLLYRIVLTDNPSFLCQDEVIRDAAVDIRNSGNKCHSSSCEVFVVLV